MTSREYLKMLSTLKMTQSGAARFLGINARTSRRYANGSSPIPHSIAMLLVLLAYTGMSPNALRAKVKLPAVDVGDERLT